MMIKAIYYVFGGLICSSLLYAQGPEKREKPERPGIQDRENRVRERPGGDRRRATAQNSPQDHENRMFDAILHNPELAAKLGISEDQVESIRSNRENSLKKMGELQQQMKAAGRKQAELMLSDEVDEEALMQAVEEAGRIHTGMAKLRMQNLLHTRKVLNPEQRKKVREMMKKKMEQRRNRMQEMREMMERRTAEGGERPSREEMMRRRDERMREQGDRPATEEMRRRREEFRERREEGAQRPRPERD